MEIIESNGYACMGVAQVDGQKNIAPNTAWGEIKERCEKLISSSNCNVLLIHHNSNQNPFWNKFVSMFCQHDNRWCVSFSGGESAESVHQHHHVFAGRVNDNGEANWNLVGFLDATKAGDENPFNILICVDPNLEAKLELLHQCLAPDGTGDTNKVHELRQKILKEEDFDFDQQIKAVWRTSSNDVDIFEGNFDQTVEELAVLKDCFSPKYLAILSALRNNLASEFEQ
jgi:hypothetical protein